MPTRFKFFAASVLAVCGVSSLSSGCSSDSSGGSTTPSPGTVIELPDGGGTVIPGDGTHKGGEIPITKAQADAIKTDSCAGESIEGESLPAVLELVIDVSSSMNDTAPGTSRSKWEVTRDALINAIPGPASGGGLGSSLGVGLLFYPNMKATIGASPQDVNMCVNTKAMVAPAALGGTTGAQRTLVRNSIQQAQLQTSTPTHDAYKHAFENGISKTTLAGKRFMLLITDGTPTLSLGCVNATGTQLASVDPEPIVKEVQRAANAGIKTFLIGSPGSEGNRNWMSRAAQIGGTAPDGCSPNGPTYCHMDMTTAPDFSKALQDGLAKVAGQIAPCEYTFGVPPSGQTIDPNKINVLLRSGSDNTLVVRSDEATCSKGWQLTANNEIHLCSDTCKAVQSDSSTSVDVVFGCQSLQEPPPIK